MEEKISKVNEELNTLIKEHNDFLSKERKKFLKRKNEILDKLTKEYLIMRDFLSFVRQHRYSSDDFRMYFGEEDERIKDFILEDETLKLIRENDGILLMGKPISSEKYFEPEAGGYCFKIVFEAGVFECIEITED